MNKLAVTILLVFLVVQSSFAEITSLQLVKEVFFGVEKVIDINLNNQNRDKILKQIEIKSKEIISKYPVFVNELTSAVNSGELTEVLHQLETVNTILVNEENGTFATNIDVVIVRITDPTMAAVTFHSGEDFGFSRDIVDSLLYREKLAMKLVKLNK
ncbi:hypothetical protein A9Q84_03100 [Halobacteriovorax marinus]|uniref:DUF4252 domain-containing protein n=1 Tax=Halobacteriovorax marinus TaxID=97084 RepID=A0A1Y5FGX9_9BACT|nr:hypothetical protein A9Q84_03100 [Halobacteriovorax marinus]